VKKTFFNELKRRLLKPAKFSKSMFKIV